MRGRSAPASIHGVPLVDVFFDPRLKDDDLARIADVLRDVVPRAVECPEEPVVGPLAVGDLEIRFRPRRSHDVGDLTAVVEVKTKRFASRLVNAQERSDLIRDALAGLEMGPTGVWLMLIDGGWSQSP